ncbi:DUF3800 domain-containing protein [Amycolatopsis sp. NPDC051372]|uniref:DUF3800 domain-containing protein n=1 Tax=Amycolatopsis sp. NPDC051372 TaxID=3155669 RepID=UPI003429AAF2
MDDSALPTVYFDESGNAGENLLDEHQPAFTLASVFLDAEATEKVIAAAQAELRPDVGRHELKFSTLRRTARGRRAIAAGLFAIPAEAAKVYVIHKRWMVVTKFVDLIIKERTDQYGVDIHATREAPKIANLLYLGGPKFGNPREFNLMLDAFVRYARNPGTAELTTMFAAVNSYRRTLNSDSRRAIDWLLTDLAEAANSYREARSSGWHEDTLDPAIPCVEYICRAWFAELGRFDVVHDQSGVTDRSLDLFRSADQLDNPLVPGTKLPTFPVDKFIFADSKEVPQLQVADWVAGAICELAKYVVLRRPVTIDPALQDHLMEWVVDSLFSIHEDNSPF